MTSVGHVPDRVSIGPRASCPLPIRLRPSESTLPGDALIESLPGQSLAWDQGVAEHARTIVVPLANPDTAVDLLRIARGLLPDQGGRLLATSVLLDDADAEKSRELSDGMADLVETVADRLTGAEVTFRTRTATSVARGILDAIRDSGADAVVLGIRSRDELEGEARLGSVVESVIDAAACDVVVYRPANGHGLSDIQRILAAVDGTRPSRNAVRVATLLRRGLHVDLDFIHVHGSDTSESQARSVVARSMTDLDFGAEVGIQLIQSDDVVEGLVDAAKESDLVVVGFDHEERSSSMEKGKVGRSLLDRVDAPMLTVARHAPSESGWQERIRRWGSWLHPRLTDVEQGSLRSYAEGAAVPTLDYVAMTTVSGVIATFGMLIDSVAVIIGAMLVAPMITPLQGFGIAVVAGRPKTALKALASVLLGSLLVFVVALLGGLLVGLDAPTAEVAARGSPSLLDAIIAIASGIAGAYATARKDIPAALAGVAIAAALVPPICAIGLGLAAGRWGLAAGATLLFLVNIACIAVIGAVAYQWMGLRPFSGRTERGQFALAAASVGALLAILALLIVVDARRVGMDDRPLEQVIADVGAEVDLAEVVVLDDRRPRTVRIVLDVVSASPDELDELARRFNDEVRQRLGDDAETRVVVRDVVDVRDN
jgi:uncharacterized hydrophobic protein (TIGR00271 family)